MVFKINRKISLGYLILFCELLFLLIFNLDSSYKIWAIISLCQLVLNLFVIWKMSNTRVLSFISFFIILNAIFYCGHIYMLGFNIEGDLNLNFTYYGDSIARIGAFKYYLYSQLLLAFGILSCDEFSKRNNNKSITIIDMKRSSKLLIILGVIPRLYIDILKLIGGFSSGYEGVYSIYIPQFINTVAFFFDVGVIIALLQLGKTRKGKILFLGILFYKCLSMITGARQENIGFLIIWIFIYFFLIRKVNVGSIIKFIFIFIIGIALIGTISTTRGNGSFTLEKMYLFILGSDVNSILGNFLGEFGSCFSSLVVPFQQIPSKVTYGLGKSYIAGLFSIIPYLVSMFSFFANQTTYISLFRGTTFFGGSMLGESYYNFGWCGLIIVFIIGYIAKKIDLQFINKTYRDYCPLKYIMAFVLSVTMLIFIRGYFTDMVQKIIWVYIILKLLNRNNNRSLLEK